MTPAPTVRRATPVGRATPAMDRLLWGGLAALLVIVVAGVVASNELATLRSAEALRAGSVSPATIYAPNAVTYISEVLTAQSRQDAAAAVDEVYNPPDSTVRLQQTTLARQILDYAHNVRRDPYGTAAQKQDDLAQITAIALDVATVQSLLTLDDDTWRQVDEQIVDLLDRVLQQTIREADVPSVVSRLPTQVSRRFNAAETQLIVALVEDLVRPNTFTNPRLTDEARARAAGATQQVTRNFEAGQIVVREGERITAADHDALLMLGLLDTTSDARLRTQVVALVRGLGLGLLLVTLAGLALQTTIADLHSQRWPVALSAGLFALALVGVRLAGPATAQALFPAAALALLVVAVAGPQVALLSALALGLLAGVMSDRGLEVATLVSAGSVMGVLALRQVERVNSFFFAGLVVALTNALVILVFNVGLPDAEQGVLLRLGFGLVGGVLAAAAAVAGLYLVTQVFNLPTGLRLVELSQPNQPLLQRLMREAPGSYYHSLQVANLAEQATHAVGGNAELVRVAALYHDIGKMLNAPFFVENQADGVNPHDALNDPYRSAAIIIGHVTEGDKLARLNRLPQRLRDFIVEHHGTTRVEYFYRQALSDAVDEDGVDAADFTYPGPRPQTRESAIMMLADGCESAVRARRPTNKQEIADVVQQILDARLRENQLDDCGLTTADLKTIRATFIEMLQAVFHPRINYPAAATPRRRPATRPELPPPATPPTPPSVMPVVAAAAMSDDEGDAPLPDVPTLPRTTAEMRAVPPLDVLNDESDPTA